MTIYHPVADTFLLVAAIFFVFGALRFEILWDGELHVMATITARCCCVGLVLLTLLSIGALEGWIVFG